MKIIPLADRVVIKTVEVEETTKGGLILTGSAKEKPQVAQVIAVGPGGVVDGKEVKMSKRTGNAITLRELCEDIGVDAARWFFVSKDVATHMDLDLKLARSKDNNNPVYYAQYAYSRMCSILRNPQIPEFKSVDVYERLTDEKEMQMLKLISEFPKEVAADALNRKPNKMTEYIITLVKVFHSYYNSTKVNNPDDPELTNERIGLIKAAMITLKNALTLIGVSAPESM